MAVDKDSHATGDIEGRYEVGGLVGYNYGIFLGDSNITGSYATGNVDGKHEIGGLVGSNDGGVLISNYAKGEATGDNNVGGLIGENDDGKITNSYSIGKVDGSSNVGGLIGANSGNIRGSYWNTETSGTKDSEGGEGRTTIQLITPTTPNTEVNDEMVYKNWNNDIWVFGTKNDYPSLK